MNLRKIVIYIALLFFFHYSSASYDTRSIDSFFNLSEKHIEVNFEEFIYGLSIYNMDSSLFFLNKVESKLKDKESKEYLILNSEIANIYSKLNDSINFQNYYNKAVSLAIRKNYYKELTNIYLLRADIFKSKNILDSAMYYSLLSIETGNKAEEFNKTPIYHLIADIYYTLEMYDEAKIYYLKAIELGENFPSWEDWRKIVIYTDLGNIFTFQGNYQFALQHYNIALEQYFENKKTKSYYQAYIQGAHLFSRIANMYFENGKLDSANYYADLSISYLDKDSLLKENYSYIFTIAGKIYSELGKLKKADELLQTALANISKSNPEKLFDVYHSLSINNERLGLLHEALMYRKKYDSSYNEFRKKNNYAKLMQIKIVNEFSQVKSELEKQRIVNKIFYLITLFLAVIVLILYYFNKKINKAYKLISRKTLEIIKQKKLITHTEAKREEVEESINESEVYNNEKNGNETIVLSQELIDLAIKIQNTLLDNPIIFNNEFNINDLSNLLNTNRDYISKAINGHYKVSFQIFLNELRVIASINLMRNNKNKNLTMDYFMEKVGFSNRATFSASFKRYTGMTPAVFYKTLEKEN